MISQESAEGFAKDWLDAWNSHHLDRILTHYAEDAVILSPIAAEVTGSSEVRGKESIRDYFRKGLETFPDLHFRLERVYCGTMSVVVCYTNQSNKHAAEFMRLDSEGKVVYMEAHYHP